MTSATSDAADSFREGRPSAVGIILLYHGSAEREWANAARWLGGKVAGAAPQAVVEIACIKDFPPSIDEAAGNLAKAGVSRALVAPMFIAPGGHAAKDFPRIAEELKSKWPKIHFEWTEVAGVWDEVAQAVAAGINARLKTGPS